MIAEAPAPAVVPSGAQQPARRTVLVTDGEQRSALAVVRSLGRSGYRVLVCGREPTSLAGSSRYAAGTVCVPDAGESPTGFVAGVRGAIAEHGVDLLVPISEPALMALLGERETLGARVPFPDLATFSAICDKSRVLREAQSVGIRVPQQQEIASAEHGRTLEPAFPLVLKPYRSVYTSADGSRGKVGVSWVRTAAELEAALRTYPREAYPLLAQEAIEGAGVGVFVLLQEGRVLAQFAHRRLREKPPSGGVSVLCQSEPMDDRLLARSVALLDRFGWSGVAMIEYKRDARTGEPVLMEINGRFWGSLQLAIDAGVDFPRLLAAVAFGDPVAPVVRYRPMRNRWFWGDTDHLVTRLRQRRGAADTLDALLTWLGGFAPRNRSEVMRWRDPAPFLWESARWLGHITHR